MSGLSPSTTAAQEKLVALSREFKQLQTELATLIDARQRLDMQATENEGVLTQLKALGNDDKVYKRLGSALLSIEADEARGNVSKRLDFIKSQMDTTDSKIDGLTKQLDLKKSTIAQAQQQVIAALNTEGDVLSAPAA